MEATTYTMVLELWDGRQQYFVRPSTQKRFCIAVHHPDIPELPADHPTGPARIFVNFDAAEQRFLHDGQHGWIFRLNTKQISPSGQDLPDQDLELLKRVDWTALGFMTQHQLAHRKVIMDRLAPARDRFKNEPEVWNMLIKSLLIG